MPCILDLNACSRSLENDALKCWLLLGHAVPQMMSHLQADNLMGKMTFDGGDLIGAAAMAAPAEDMER